MRQTNCVLIPHVMYNYVISTLNVRIGNFSQTIKYRIDLVEIRVINFAIISSHFYRIIIKSE